MSSIDDRIVNMKFNNAQFGQGVTQTKRDLTGLETAVVNAGKSKGMTSLGASVDKVSLKFRALQVAGVAVLGTIVAKATSAGLRLIKSFTIQPIIDGFKEYQTGLESVQTIMSNTGKDVKTVNKYLDELNSYADKTIYNFAQMAKNIGTFTAAGVRLPEATASIKGIANLAAVSGSTSQQASTAMYQLSQAIAAGRVNLQDWNSVVNAGMGGKIFQTALARTAQGFGTLEKGAVTLNKETGQLLINGQAFRNTISAAGGGEPWLTGQILVETLKQVGGEFKVAELRSKGFTEAQIKDIQDLARTAFDAATQIKTFPQLIGVIKESLGSTVAQGFRVILGDFTKSKKLWGDAGYALLGPSGYITKIQNSFTSLIESWNKGKGQYGRFKLIEGVKNVFKSLIGIMGAVAKAWRDVFPATSGKDLFEITRTFKRFTENLIPSGKTLKSLRSIFGGLFSILHIGVSIVTGIAGGFAELFVALFDGSKDARGGFLQILGSIGEVVTGFDKWLTSGDRLTNGLKTIGTAVGAVFAPVVFLVGAVVKAFAALASGKGIGAIAKPIDELTDGFLTFVEKVLAGLAELTSPFDKVSGFFSGLQDKLSGMSGDFSKVLEPLSNINLSFGGGGGTGFFDQIIDAAKRLGDAIVTALNDVQGAMDDVKSKADSVGGAIGDKVTGGITKIGDAADVVKGKTGGVFDSITGAGATAASTSLNKVGDTASGVGDVFSVIGGIFKAVGQGLADALGFMVEQLSKIPFPNDALDWATLLNALISGALIKRLFFSKGILQQMRDTIKEVGISAGDAFDDIGNALKTWSAGIKADIIYKIAVSVGLLVAALAILAYIPQEKLAQGLGALAAVMLMLGTAMTVLVKMLDTDSLSKTGLTTKMGSIAALSSVLVSFGAAIVLLAGAIAILAFIPLKNLAQGMGAVVILITVMVKSIEALANVEGDVAKAGLAMVLMATAINLLVFAIVALGFLPMENLAIGLGAVAIGVGLMVGALVLMSKYVEDVGKSAAALILVALAINLLVTAVLALAFIPLENLAAGLGAIGIGLVLMVGALILLEKFAPGAFLAGEAMLLLSGALVAMAIAVGMLGAMSGETLAKGLVAMAVGLGLLIGAAYLAMPVIPGLSALAAIIGAIGIALLATGAGFLMFATGLALLVALGTAGIAIITLAIGAFIALLPNIAVQMAAAFVAFLQAIALAAPKIRKALGIIFKNMLQAAEENLPRLAKLVQEGLTFLIQVVTAFAPAMYEAAWRILQDFLDSIADHLPDVIDSAYEIAYAIIDGMGKRAVDLANAGADALVEMLNGLAEAVETKGPLIREAMGNLASAMGTELKNALADVFAKINPAQFLPDISLPGIGKLDNPFNKKRFDPNAPAEMPGGYDGKAKKSPLETALEATAISVSLAVSNSIKLLVNAIEGPLYELAKTAKDLQRSATSQSTKADLYSSTADVAQEAADAQMDRAKGIKGKAKINKKGVGQNKKGKAVVAARKAQKFADKQAQMAEREARRADIAQRNADYAAQQSADALQYRDDPKGLADAKAAQGADLSQQADDLQAMAKAKADEIKRLMGLAESDKKNSAKYKAEAARLRKEAAADTKEALLLSTQAIEAQRQAVLAYAEARKAAALDAIESMAEIRARVEAERKEREWQAAYDLADDKGKKAMLAARQAENERIATEAEGKLAAALAVGDALAAKIARGEGVTEEELAAAQKAAEEAAKQADIAAKARDAAKQDADAIKSMNEQTASGNTTGNSNLTPSRSVLEDAANAVDRYSASVAAAEQAASASSTAPLQFVQNNYSPEALSNATIYRQSNNLISAASDKLQSPPT